MNIKAFIFDLDGVITDTAVYHFQAWQRMAHRLGIEFTHEDNEELKGVSRRDSLERILEKSDREFSEEEKLRLMDEKNEDYKQLIGSITQHNMFDGVRECFDELRKRGIKTALASASRNARTIVASLGIESDFDFLADAAKVANSKPAPDIFIAAMEGLGLQANECIGIEDAAAGVESIKSANMFAVGIGDAEILSQADIVFSDMKSLDIDRVLEKAT